MIKPEQRVQGTVRDTSPCKDCKDRHPACSDKCDRYKAWKAEIERVKKVRKNYLDNRHEELKRRDKWDIRR